MDPFFQWFLDQLSSMGTPALIMMGATIAMTAWIIFSAVYGPDAEGTDEQ